MRKGRENTRVSPGLILPLLLLLWMSACGAIAPDEEITLINETDGPLVYLVVGLEDSYLMDPNPSFKVTPDHERLLRRDESATVPAREIARQGNRYRWGDDLVILLWKVSMGEANLEGSLDLTHVQLRRQDFRVQIAGRDLVI